MTPTPATLSLAAPLDTAGVATVAEQAAAGLVRVDSSDGGVGGSGVIFTEGGEVLTNAHLVAGLESVELTLADGTAVTGTVLGTDEVTDLAVVSAELPDSVGPALLGSSRDLTTGEAAVLVASPQPGSREPSVTVGVVSGVGRTLVRTDGAHLLDMLQTDASIPPGASGAVLVDRRGAVIGLLTTVGATDPGASGLGYATPIDLARAIAIDIVETGSARHAWLGVDGNDLPTAEAAPLGLVGGAQVRVVTTDSPAQRAGLMDRDIIVRVADAEITSMAGLIVALRDHDPGDDVHIDYIRGGQPRECTASLSDWPEGGA